MSTITAASLRQIAKDARVKMLDANYLRVLDYVRERAYSGHYVGRISVPSCVVEELCVKLHQHGFATRQTSDGAGSSDVAVVIAWEEA